MEPLRLDAVAARVVAWHNTHPLARRITVAQVQSVGYVGLPFRVAGRAPGGLPAAAASGGAADAAAADGSGAGGSTGGGTGGGTSGSLRERAQARARQQDAEASAPSVQAAQVAPGADRPEAAAPAAPAAVPRLQPAFDEDFIAPLQPRRVARWAAVHGRLLAAAPTDGPLRRVLTADSDAAASADPVLLYVLTAAVEAGGVRRRLLLGAGAQAPVLGGRVWSLPRLVSAVLAPLLLAGAALGLAHWPAPPAAAEDAAAAAVAAASAAAAASEATAASAALSGPSVSASSVPSGLSALSVPTTTAGPAAPPWAPADEPGLSAAAAAASAPPIPSAPPPIAAPLDVEPRRGIVDMPRLGRVIDRGARDTRDARDARDAGDPAARALPQADAAAAAATSAPPRSADAEAAAAAGAIASAPVPAPPAPRADAAGPRAGAFAVSSRPLRTRAEAEQVMAAMDALLRGAGAAGVQVEILPQGLDWRVVGWPYGRQADAEKARSLLAGRGMRVAVVGF